MKSIIKNSTVAATILFFVLVSFSTYAQNTTSTETYNISKKDLKEYVGEYKYDGKAERGFDITVSLDGESNLMAQPTDKSQPLSLAMALGKDKFELAKTGGLILSFTRSKKGGILSLTISKGDNSFTCLRQ